MSSLCSVEERGAAYLISDRGRVEWRFPDVTHYRKLPYCSDTVQFFPDTGRHELNEPAAELLPIQALHVTGFMRSRHAGIDIPARVLARSIIDDAQERVRQDLRGEATVGRTLAVFPAHSYDGRQVLLVLCVGGPTRSDLFASELDCGVFTATERPFFQTVAPIVQVSTSGNFLLVMSVGSIFVGTMKAIAGGYRFDVAYTIHTSSNGQAQCADALLVENGLATIDTLGAVRLYDASGSQSGSVRLGDGTRDPCWHLAWTGDAMLAASSSCVYSVDNSGSQSCITSTCHSPTMLQKSVNTSIVSLCGPEFALATTDDVLRYDMRNMSSPVHVWTHWRGFDRSLTLTKYEKNAVVLSSQDNRLLTVYDIIPGEYAQRIAPTQLPSSVPSGHPQSPSPPCIVDHDLLGTDSALLLEQTMRGAVWGRWIGADVPVNVRWPPGAVRNELLSRDKHDSGPFGQAEGNIYDLRVVYKAAFLGWLGMGAPDASENTAPRLLHAMQRASGSNLTLLDAARAASSNSFSLVHWSTTLGKAALYGDTLQKWTAILSQVLNRRDARLCLNSCRYWIGWNPDIEQARPDELVETMAQQRSLSSVDMDAAQQEALDVLLSSVHVGRSERVEHCRRHGNWVWDRSEPEPRLPTADYTPLLAADRDLTFNGPLERISDAATLLLYEWPLGTNVQDYVYTNPYQGLDLQTRATKTQDTVPPIMSQRTVPPIMSQRAAPPVSSQGTASQSSQDQFHGVQSQAVRGRFGQRAPPAKRRKRMGGF